MTSAEATEPGLRPDHHYEIRVYYEDTDAAGIVYYANYLKFAERARTEMMRERGASHEGLRRRAGLAFVVRRCLVEYHRPARLDDRLDVQTHIGKIGGASLELRQLIYQGDRLLVSLDVKLALLNEAMRPARIPKPLIAALRPQYKVGKSGKTVATSFWLDTSAREAFLVEGLWLGFVPFLPPSPATLRRPALPHKS